MITPLSLCLTNVRVRTMKKDNPFEELLESMSRRGQAKSDDDDGPPHSERHEKLSHAQMLKHLMVGYGFLTQPRKPLKAGDIVRGIRELTESHIRDWDHPHIILEILEKPVRLTLDHEAISTNISSKHYDCVVLSCVPTKGKGWILQHFADSREWELFPDADKLKTDTHS